jgi:2,4-dienoyl-CoA reductase-like NADH-dependent reductase (Old Yellow Enzyme family)
VHCGRQTTAEAIGTQPIAPSPVDDTFWDIVPREMTERDIERVIMSFAQAAGRVKQSGFDAVQIHGAHGYLVNQFLSPHTNRREDQWGGSIENRMRFLREIYQRSRQIVGDDFPMLIKINAQDGMQDGLRLEESVIMAQMMSDMGFDGIEVSRGINEDGGCELFGNGEFGGDVEEAYNRDAARLIKQSVQAPVFLVGGLTDPSTMANIIENGDADYISMCRALIANPDFPNKITAGSREPSRCTRCHLCIDGYSSDNPLRCYEWEYE